MTDEELVAAYLARGGRVTVCPTGTAFVGAKPKWHMASAKKKPRVRNPWWVRTDWKLVKVSVEMIAPAERWLRERDIKF